MQVSEELANVDYEKKAVNISQEADQVEDLLC